MPFKSLILVDETVPGVEEAFFLAPIDGLPSMATAPAASLALGSIPVTVPTSRPPWT